MHGSRNLRLWFQDPFGTKRSLQWDLRMYQKPLSWAWVGDTGKSVKRWGLGLRLATPMREGAWLRSAGGSSQRPSPPVCGLGGDRSRGARRGSRRRSGCRKTLVRLAWPAGVDGWIGARGVGQERGAVKNEQRRGGVELHQTSAERIGQTCWCSQQGEGAPRL